MRAKSPVWSGACKPWSSEWPVRVWRCGWVLIVGLALYLMHHLLLSCSLQSPQSNNRDTFLWLSGKLTNLAEWSNNEGGVWQPGLQQINLFCLIYDVRIALCYSLRRVSPKIKVSHNKSTFPKHCPPEYSYTNKAVLFWRKPPRFWSTRAGCRFLGHREVAPPDVFQEVPPQVQSARRGDSVIPRKTKIGKGLKWSATTQRHLWCKYVKQPGLMFWCSSLLSWRLDSYRLTGDVVVLPLEKLETPKVGAELLELEGELDVAVRLITAQQGRVYLVNDAALHLAEGHQVNSVELLFTPWGHVWSGTHNVHLVSNLRIQDQTLTWRKSEQRRINLWLEISSKVRFKSLEELNLKD